jgi:hypothetical protein
MSLAIAGMLCLAACTSVGPEYSRPESPLGPDWYQEELAGLSTSPLEEVAWWKRFGDPELDRLVERALAENNTLEIAGLRVLESRAQLGIATGLQYPQSQVMAGGATGVSASNNAANTAAGDLEYVQYDLGAAVTWEIDFWGRYRRGIEAADALYLQSLAARDELTVLVASQVALAYLTLRTIEDQIRITLDNVASQQRSFDIVDVQFRNGDTSELDVLQAQTLLLSNRSIPDGSTEFFVLHRETGVPLSNVSAEVFAQRYDYRKSENTSVKLGDFSTDAKGFFRIPFQSKNEQRNFIVNFRKEEDFNSTVSIDQQNRYYGGNIYQYKEGESKARTQTFFFLDRAIYRPGQTIYFKGLVIQTDGKNPVIKKKYSTTIKLRDVNSQE